ncbi:ATP-grasp domain-containing protein [Streptomyces sp. SP18CS02]|uniref:ATP-grasp domain-containing protein n=1 Tax=Streptomyces sp. SP18CS02 TaxID=3002531 RepID=UPI002E78D6B8|nr:ATP-grasp domain-containing protein [Streptomyces sp. SP18CS02]MEE1756035.1 ATP-grasp domain-containing protein [Streptomyces sp. SP18CS02]
MSTSPSPSPAAPPAGTARPTAVVVDGYSAGNFYPAAFAAAGARVIHVQSTPELIPTMLAPDLTAYDENIVCSDEERLVELLRPYAPVAVVPGQESAVQLADRLSEALGVKSNGTALSPARRDKHEMIEALRRAGVRCADQFKSDDAELIVKWAQDHGSWPVVVKPISSAASDGVFVCDSAEEVRAAALRVLETRDIFGFANAEALVQSYLKGTEYVVDTVSCDGRRYVSGVWEYEKILLPSGQNIYNRDVLLSPDEDPVPALIAYIHEVLTALDVRWGPAHAEVIVTEQGPVLVEVATRLNGQVNPGFQELCLGADQAGLTVLAYTRPEEFQREYADRVYSKLRPACIYNADTTLDGQVAEVDQEVVARINALPSTFSTSVKYAPGARIRPTTDLLTATMRIYLTSDDDQRLTADYKTVRELKDSVYRLA